MAEHVEVRVTCDEGHSPHTLATFVPSIVPADKGFWVGDQTDLSLAPWESWSLITATAKGRRNPTDGRPNLHTSHDAQRATRDGDDWRFYCRRCRLAVRVTDKALGSVVTDAAARGVLSIGVGALR